MSYVLNTLDMIGQSPVDELFSDFKSRVNNFVNGDKAQAAFHSAAGKAFNVVKTHHKAVLKAAVAVALHHVTHEHGIGGAIPADLEDHVHHQIKHIATTLGVTKDIAHHMMTHAVGQLKSLRGLEEQAKNKSKDEELDDALIKVHKVLKKIEKQYRGVA
jgi:hypothetical protein